MAFVVTEACIKCKFTDCVDVCPVDAFHAGPNFLVIEPDVCIDCAVCVPECPVSAIVDQQDLAQNQLAFEGLNATLSQRWPRITSRKKPPEDADEWSRVASKLHLLQE